MRIDQAIFGYDAGHNLLAASIDLPPTWKQILSVATDLSGQPPIEGFESTYTGLALPGGTHYALFCTWLAPEMERPGCVWTHVLLIQLADLAVIKNLFELTNLFRRYTLIHGPGSYKNPIDYWNATSSPLSQVNSVYPGIDPSRARLLIESLYDSFNGSIVIGADCHEDYLTLIFAIWSQQWPRLRRAFQFSTGSFGNRGKAGILFDLQIIPRSVLRAVRGDSVKIIDRADESKLQSGVEWLENSIGDLTEPNGLRTFLFQFGADIDEPRKSFVKLARIYARRFEPCSIQMTFIANVFPNPDDAVRLKETIAADHPPQETFSVIRFLANCPEAIAFSRARPDLTKHAKVLWEQHRQEAIQLISDLLSSPMRTSADSFVTAIASIISPEDLEDISRQSLRVALILSMLNEELAASASMWRLSDSVQSTIIESLDGRVNSQIQWEAIARAVLEAEAIIPIHVIVQHLGEKLLKIISDHLIKADRLPRTDWKEPLRMIALNRIREEESPEVLAVCCWVLLPTFANEPSRLKDFLKPLGDISLGRLPAVLQEPVAFTFTGIGLAVSNEGSIFLAKGLHRTYEALAKEHVEPDRWRFLSPLLPDLAFWDQWDRCKRLRKAVREWAKDTNGGKAALLSHISSESEREFVCAIFK